MPCEMVPTKGKMGYDGPLYVTMCRGRVRRKRCYHCGKLGADYLCDGPVAVNKTCDRPICAGCATSGGPDSDYCRDCARDWPGRGS